MGVSGVMGLTGCVLVVSGVMGVSCGCELRAYAVMWAYAVMLAAVIGCWCDGERGKMRMSCFLVITL